MPRCEQSRATAWHVDRWCSEMLVDQFIIENVRAFLRWGRLLNRGRWHKGRWHKAGTPDPRYYGEYFNAWINAKRNMGYHIEWKLQCAADFGDPTSRERLIIMGSRLGPIVWPEPTHRDPLNLTPETLHLPTYRSARDHVIDWSLRGTRIDEREALGLVPLSDNTIERIIGGFKEFSGAAFVVHLRGTSPAHLQASAHSLDEPLGTQTTTGKHHVLVEPEPFVIHVTHHGKRRAHSIHGQIPTITGAKRGELALIEPEAFMIGQHSCATARSVRGQVPTLCQKSAVQIIEPEPFVTKYYGTGKAKSLRLPLDTLTTRDRFLVVTPEGIKWSNGDPIPKQGLFLLTMPDGRQSVWGARTRMLATHEAAAAMSFPKNYIFTGTKEDQMKQIGNAVPVEMARAHVRAALSQYLKKPNRNN